MHLNHPEIILTPETLPWSVEIVFHETDPWSQKSLGTALCYLTQC